MTTTPFHALHHVCIVVHDLEKAVRYYESLGIGPWEEYPPLDGFTDRVMPNDEAFLQLKYKLVNLDNIQLQLCEPPHLDCPQRRYLDEFGEGVFHLGFEYPIKDGVVDGQALGLDVLMRGARPNGTGFVYFNTVPDAGTPEDVAEADIVCTCTTSATPVFDGRLLPENVHVNAIGAYRPGLVEVDDHTVRTSAVWVDERAAAQEEAGDLIRAATGAEWGFEQIRGDLALLCSAAGTEQSRVDRRTLFKSVGIASEDLVIAEVAYRRLRS